MLRRICGGLLIGAALWSGLVDLRTTLADVGPVPQWIQLKDQIPDHRPMVIVDRKGVSRKPAQKPPYLQKSFHVSGALKSATLELMADGDDVIAWIDDDASVLKVSSITNRWVRVDLTNKLKAGKHDLRIAGWGAICARLKLVGEDGRKSVIVTDPTWREAHYAGLGRNAPIAAIRDVTSLGLVGIQPWGDPLGEEVDYDQWKKSISTGKAEDSATVQVTPGFEVELVRSSQSGESSWISLTFDPEGRVIIGREGRDKKHGLLRLTLPKQAGGEVQAESLEDTLLEPRGLAFYGKDLFVNANNAHSLVRLRDTDNDGRFDEQTVLKKTPGGVGHGRNNLAFGPDGKLYSIHGNDVKLPDDFDRRGVAPQLPSESRSDSATSLRNPNMRVPFMALDRLRPCDWDGFLFDRNATLPAGHLVRTDIDGSRWEVVATGFRNPYGIAFNEDGEAFTFDADNEGDLGAPWYRPTRINHIVEGGDYGWRQGTAMRPDWYPDSMPSTLVIGKSSPTGIKFGTKSNYPERYRKSLFILDWSYGRIYAVQLLPHGSSYVGTAEVFVEGRPLNVTNLTFGPDGAMYFTTGGRGTQSGLYRVRYVGPESVIAPPDVMPYKRSMPDIPITNARLANYEAGQREQRRRLERMQPTVADLALIAVRLDDRDEWIRHAAMTALMRFDVSLLLEKRTMTFGRSPKPCEGDQCLTYERLWRDHAMTPRGRIIALMAFARMLPVEEQPRLLELLCDEWEQADADRRNWKNPLAYIPTSDDRLIALRAIQHCLLRVQTLDASVRERIIKIASSTLDGRSHQVDLFAFQILAHFDSAPIEKAIERVKAASRPQDQERALVWLFELRDIKTGWTPETRKAYLEELRRVGEHAVGGRELPVVLYSIGADFKATLSDQEREQFADLLTTPAPHAHGSLVPQRPLVKEWTVDELVPSLAKFEMTRERVERGRKIFEQANCVKCHRFAGAGQPIGPDLNGVSGRMGRKDLLETILVPSKVIDDKYKDTTLELKDGRVLTGRMIGGDATRVLISPNPLAPFATVPVVRSEVESQKVSAISPMPVGLLNSFHTEEILDLLAYIDSNGAIAR